MKKIQRKVKGSQKIKRPKDEADDITKSFVDRIQFIST
jgi:hypothetical protein